MNNIRIRILLVEDNAGDARLIKCMLKEAKGLVCEVEWVETLDDGSERLAAGEVDMLLLDLGLPGSGRLDTLKRLQQRMTRLPALVILSELSDEEADFQAVQAGAQDYLIKGKMNASLLVRSIRYAIERSQAREALRQAHEALHDEIQKRRQTEDMLRKRLAREIHDELGQYLSALRLGISIIGLQFGKENAVLQEKIQSLVKLADSMIKAVRDLVTALRPAVLDRGLVPALEELASEFKVRTGVPCRLRTCEGDIPLDEKRATQLFRIVQESLTNISRHAEATEVDITLDRDNAHYFLKVHDNGKGFDPAIRRKKSFGLAGIRERALLLGGAIDIVSAPGHGAAIKVCFPIESVPGEL